MATISNLYIDGGSDYDALITVWASAGVPLNLTNYTVRSQIRKSYGSSQVFNFTAVVFDAALGQIRLSLSAAQSDLIPAGRWLYDVEITNAINGVKKRAVEGLITVTPQITQST